MNSVNHGESAPTFTMRLEDWFQHRIEDPATDLVGGRAHLRVVLLLACTIALDSADKAMVGAVAVPLKKALGMGNLQLAMLIAGPTFVTALATLPFGVLADRINRTKLLTAGIVTWAVLMIIGGASTSYTMLLLVRLVLGAAIAISIPVVMSLTGDYFQPRERARIWGYILAGELAGVAIGYLLAGNIAAVLSWHASFWTLGGLSLILAPFVWRLLPEPARGGQSQIPVGADKIPAAGEGGDPVHESPEDAHGSDAVEDNLEEQNVRPHPSLVLHKNPVAMPFGRAVRYTLSIRTNVVLISASALGYFFFGTLITFGVVYMRNRFGLGQAVATTLSVALGAGAIIGVLISGRLADRLIQRGRVNARVVVASTAFLISAVLFLPALLMSSIFIVAPLFFLAAVALGGANPPLDAARLDIMHFQLWGRAESVRASLRYLAQAIAPLAFSGIFILFSGGGSLFDAATGHVHKNGSIPLAYTFLIMLIPLAAAGGVLLMGIRSYPRDVATARASEQAD